MSACGRFDVVMVGHGRGPLPDRPRPSRPSWRSPDGGRNGPEPGAKRRAEAQRRMAEAGYFVSRCKGAVNAMCLPRGARRKIAGRSHCRPGPPAVRSPSRRPWARPLPALVLAATGLSTSIEARRAYSTVAVNEAGSGRRPPARAASATLLGGHRGRRRADPR